MSVPAPMPPCNCPQCRAAAFRDNVAALPVWAFYAGAETVAQARHLIHRMIWDRPWPPRPPQPPGAVIHVYRHSCIPPLPGGGPCS